MNTASTKHLSGVGRVLVVVYAIMALGSLGRSFVQITRSFSDAPLAFSLSAAAAVVYLVATVALVFSGRRWGYRLAWIALGFEMLGVLVVGTLSLVMPELFAHDTVWSWFGRGYVFIPLVLPVLGMWWLLRHRPVSEVAAAVSLENEKEVIRGC